MRRAKRLIAVLLLVPFLLLGVSFVASESGEVVTLQTQGPDGGPRETRLWIVDEGGKLWLRAGGPESKWLLDIQRNPAVQVEREGRSARYTAVPDTASRDRLNPLFAEKYGWADAYIDALLGRDDATPIRLDPQ
jgi:hypothetical protein